VAKNNPENVTEFHDHTISEVLDRTIKNPQVRKFLAGFFYPTEPIPLRAELKREIRAKLALQRWPKWFIVPTELRFDEKRNWLFKQYNKFISRRSDSRRMPIALYYKAILSEYSPDLNLIVERETLHFYNDYPHDRSSNIWWTLYTDFGDSRESIEARWRIARIWAGQGRFKEADNLAAEGHRMAKAGLTEPKKQPESTDTLSGLFRPPPDSVITCIKLEDLLRRFNHLRLLISAANRTDHPDSQKRLARFVMLNPHTPEYDRRLDELLEQTDQTDPLHDNILLAQAKRIPDELRRADRLAQLHKQYQDTDGGMQALYELARLRINLYQNQQDSQQKRQYLAEARATLTSFLTLYPESFCADQVRNILSELPEVD